jgi:ribonuclease R
MPKPRGRGDEPRRRRPAPPREGQASPARDGGGGTRGQPVGIFRRATGGYGFVRPLDAVAGDRTGDIHVAASAALDAVSGDTVRVRLHRGRDAGRPGLSGEIVEVVARRTTRFVGTYFEAAGGGFVRIDGTAFAQPVAVGDPGAKGVRENDKVVVEIVRFPTHGRAGEGVVAPP